MSHWNKKGVERPQWDGIQFESNLEVFMYRELKKAEVPFEYEGRSFSLMPKTVFPNESYETFLNGKGRFKERGKGKAVSCVYTPDFSPPGTEPPKWIIEVKGAVLGDFSMRWRLFKKHIKDNGWDTVLFMPRSQKDCRETVALLFDLDLI